jgi:hypothetical protein
MDAELQQSMDVHQVVDIRHNYKLGGLAHGTAMLNYRQMGGMVCKAWLALVLKLCVCHQQAGRPESPQPASKVLDSTIAKLLADLGGHAHTTGYEALRSRQLPCKAPFG